MGRFALIGWDEEFELIPGALLNEISTIIPYSFHESHSKAKRSICEPSLVINNLIGILYSSPLKIFEIFNCPSESLEINQLNWLELENCLIQYNRISNYRLTNYELLRLTRIIIGLYAKTLKESKTSTVLFRVFPHLYVDYCIFTAAKLLGISAYVIQPTRGINKLMKPTENILSSYCQVYNLSTLKKESIESIHTSSTKENVLSLAKSHVNEFVEKAKVASSVVTGSKYLADIQTNFKHNRNIDASLTYLSDISKSAEFLANLLRHYKTLSQPVGTISEKTDYLLFPLAKQPEASSNPRAGALWDQQLLVNILAPILKYHGINLIIKEHPNIFKWPLNSSHHFLNSEQFPRSNSFYSSLTAHDNVYLLDLDVNLDQLLLQPNCLGAVTVEGSIGITCLGLRKPIFHCTDPWYASTSVAASITSLTSKPNEVRLTLTKMQNLILSTPLDNDLEKVCATLFDLSLSTNPTKNDKCLALSTVIKYLCNK